MITIAQADRALFERINNKVIELGYFPDISKYLNGTDCNISSSESQSGSESSSTPSSSSASNAEAFDAAKDAIRQSGKKLIETFGPGNYTSRDEKNANNIIINRLPINPAFTGVAKSQEIRVKGNAFKAVEVQHTNYDIEYEVRYVTNRAEYARIIEQIIIDVFGSRAFIPAIDEHGCPLDELFWLHRRDSFDVSGTDYIERGVRFVGVNIDLHGETDIRPDVAKKTAIEIQVDISGDIESFQFEDESSSS